MNDALTFFLVRESLKTSTHRATAGLWNREHHAQKTFRTATKARRLRVLVVLLVLILVVESLIQVAPTFAQNANPVGSALYWLESNQQSNGSYGTYTELQTAPAAYALWLGSRSSPQAVLGYNFLKNQLQNSTTWFWGGGGNLAEADVPGEILYSFDATQHLGTLSLLSSVVGNLTKLQQSNGGFIGYYDSTSNRQVTSSVDTAMALWGLLDANSITATREQNVINYLFSLQNTNGSFNLTSTVSSNSLYSLGPEPISITGLVVLVLKDAGYSSANSHISSALNYLENAASAGFNGHVYSASLSALAFQQYHLTAYSTTAVNFIVSQQNVDGGFRDTIRMSTTSNALDTGWAAVSLQLAGAFCLAQCAAGGPRIYFT